MNYIDDVAKKIGDECGMYMEVKDERRLLRIYALLCLAVGKDCTLEDVHDAWAVWRLETKPDHKSIVPFEELDTDTQEMDRKYAEAIQKVFEDLQ